VSHEGGGTARLLFSGFSFQSGAFFSIKKAENKKKLMYE
jgi:hypothetical protein